ncbi:MAG: FG-GAP-like repeat-containing protein [Verrucomicrobia bacterium]|nr:FG-GAP-like repeat-containing protein [Verrucomicrobiota bacterium]
MAKLTDITGDGLADLVLERAAPGELWFWVNRGNYTFSPRKRVTGMPVGVGSNAAIRWADLNGNGSTDLIYADGESLPRLATVDIGGLLCQGGTPNALIAITNGIGRVTLIGHEPSTRFALEDAAAGRPWPDPMPFPVQVVSSVTNLDSLGHAYVTRFRYHDGYYDPVEKQFRGFARVEQVDTGDVSAPTLVTRSHFDTGRTNEAMKGKLLRLTAEQEDGGVFWDEETSWTIPPKTLYTGTNGTNVVYVHPTATVKVIKELGQGIERRLETETDFDGYGNQTRLADYGVVVDGDRSAFNDERITTTEYAINTNAWILRLPARQETKDEHGAVISRAEFFYDDETFSGSNWGILTIGNLTMKREWIDPATRARYVTAARTKYDALGNPALILDPLAVAPGGVLDIAQGHAREIAYDPRFRTYPVRETIHLGEGKAPLIFRASYDEAFGTVTSSMDFNENVTTYGYDPFARLTSMVKPGDTADYPTVEYTYALAVPCDAWSAEGLVRGAGLVNYVETRQRDKTEVRSPKSEMYWFSRQFVDGLGRKLMTKTEAEPVPGSTAPRVVVTEAIQFNARQQPARLLNPFFSLPVGAEVTRLKLLPSPGPPFPVGAEVTRLCLYPAWRRHPH